MRDQPARPAPRRWRAVFAVSAVAVVAVVAGVVSSTRPDAQQVPPPPTAVPVTVTHAALGDVPITVSGLGTVQALNSVLIRARVDGMLMEVPVAEGQSVKPGDLIAVIDPRPYKAALDQAMANQQQDEAQLTNATRDLARYGSLIKQDFASHQQYDTQQAQVAKLTAAIAGDKAAVEAAQLNVSYCYITSPIPGRVGLRLVDPGNMVHAADQTGIISIAQDKPITVVFTLPEQDLPAITKAMAQGKLPVTALSGNDKTELDRGVLLTPDNAIDQTTGTIKLKASFPNPHNSLWPGQFVDTRLLLGTEHQVITVPPEAVQDGPAGLYVYVVKPDSTVIRKPVDSHQQGNVAVITKGLQPGEEVVLTGQSRLDDGVRVAVEQPQA